MPPMSATGWRRDDRKRLPLRVVRQHIQDVEEFGAHIVLVVSAGCQTH